MAFEGPIINKGSGLDRKAANKDRVIMLVCGGVATAGLALNEPIRIVSLAQAEAKGINAAYDAANEIRVYDHLKEIYRLAPTAEVVVAITERPTTNFSWFEEDGVVEKLLRKPVAKDVKYVFTAWNPEATFSLPASYTGLPNAVIDEIPKAQLLINRFFKEKRYLDGIMLDGFTANDLGANAQDLRENNAPNISVCVALDDFSKNASIKGASIGATAGMYCARKIHENLGSVEVQNPPPAFKGQENYPLDNGIRWANAYLIDGTLIDDLPMNVQKDLANKGYVFAGSFADYPGIYLSGDPTACSLQNDFAYITHNCVWNKAAREVRKAMIPKIRSVLKKDPTTGYLKPTTAEALAQRGQKPLDGMVASGECSAAKISINPAQTPNDQVPLKARLQVQINGILHNMEIDIALVNQIII